MNGVDNMLYISSQSTGDGNLTITVTFKRAPTSMRRRCWCRTAVAIALPRLPQEVQALGRRHAQDLARLPADREPDLAGRLASRDYISNYALTQVRDRLGRLDGVGDVRLFGARDYAMRCGSIRPRRGL
jgi:multidrug efflux pump subunit AcrB